MVQDNANYCKMVQHGATSCKMVQDGATLCNMVKHGATLCNLVQNGAKWCNMVQHDAKWCIMVHYGALWCNMLQLGAIEDRLSALERDNPEAKRRFLGPMIEQKLNQKEYTKDTVGLTRFYWILSSNPAILVEISTRITEFSERIQ